jgi:hypothetical protein
MTKEQKIIRAKVRLLELAKQLGNVSQARKMTALTVSRNFTRLAANWRCKSWCGASRS